jgi:hypothetical protein
MPHIGWKQNETPWRRLNGAAYGLGKSCVKPWLSKLDPTLLVLAVGNRVRDGDVVTRTDPALGMDMIGMVTAIVEPG